MALKAVQQQDMDKARDEARKHRRAVEQASSFFVPKFHFCDLGEVVSGRAANEESRSLLGMAMEYIDGCSLGALLRKKGPGSLHRHMVYAIVQDLFIALARLHENGIVHCDVKSDNVLVDRSGYCHLCDFGCATFLEDHTDQTQPMPMAGTPSHMAPELVKTDPIRFNCKLDVWSAGILCFEMALGRTPWHDEADGHLPEEGYIFQMLKVIQGVDVSMVQIKGPFERMLEDCFEVDPEERTHAKDVFQDPQFSRINVTYREMLAELI